MRLFRCGACPVALLRTVIFPSGVLARQTHWSGPQGMESQRSGPSRSARSPILGKSSHISHEPLGRMTEARFLKLWPRRFALGVKDGAGTPVLCSASLITERTHEPPTRPDMPLSERSRRCRKRMIFCRAAAQSSQARIRRADTSSHVDHYRLQIARGVRICAQLDSGDQRQVYQVCFGCPMLVYGKASGGRPA